MKVLVGPTATWFALGADTRNSCQPRCGSFYDLFTAKVQGIFWLATDTPDFPSHSRIMDENNQDFAFIIVVVSGQVRSFSES